MSADEEEEAFASEMENDSFCRHLFGKCRRKLSVISAKINTNKLRIARISDKSAFHDERDFLRTSYLRYIRGM